LASLFFCHMKDKTKISPMRITHLNKVVDLYVYANQFTDRENIYLWTENGVKQYPDLNYVLLRGDEIIGAISGIIGDGSAIINDIAVS